MRTPDSRLVAYMKPLIKSALHPRAAYEKIASDLAFEVTINLPPVALYRRPDLAELDDPSPDGEARLVALSLVPRIRWEWRFLFDCSRADGGMPSSLPALAELARQVLAASSGVVAFDAWLGNTDRNNTRNALLARGDDGSCEMLFIDYAITMDYDGKWGQGEFQAYHRLELPAFFAACIRKDEVEAATTRIGNLANDVIREIVGRIPDDFLGVEHRSQLVDWLLWRKEKLRPALDQWYPGT